MRKNFRLLFLLGIIAVFAFTFFAHTPAEAAWPAKNMRFNLVAGYNPGGQVDAICRISAPYLQEALGIPVVVQNIPGSVGLVGANSVFGGKSDGYTAIYTATVDGIWGYKSLSPTAIPWELSDWKGTGIFGRVGLMGIVCLKTKPWQNIADLIEEARKLPPKAITVGVNGPGALNDLQIIEIQEKFGIQLNVVFYEGSAANQADLMTGDIDAALIGVTRRDFIDHPQFRVLCGLVAEYPEGCEYRGKYPVMKDFEKRLGYKVEDLPAIAIDVIASFIVKADIPDEAYKKICDAVKKMTANKEWQTKINSFTFATYVPPEDQGVIFDKIAKTFQSYEELHHKYVPR